MTNRIVKKYKRKLGSNVTKDRVNLIARYFRRELTEIGEINGGKVGVAWILYLSSREKIQVMSQKYL